MGKLFVNLKKSFTTAPILTHFNPTWQCFVETNVSDVSNFKLEIVLA
jgi:hypothetical protein